MKVLETGEIIDLSVNHDPLKRYEPDKMLEANTRTRSSGVLCCERSDVASKHGEALTGATSSRVNSLSVDAVMDDMSSAQARYPRQSGFIHHSCAPRRLSREYSRNWSQSVTGLEQFGRRNCLIESPLYVQTPASGPGSYLLPNTMNSTSPLQGIYSQWGLIFLEFYCFVLTS